MSEGRVIEWLMIQSEGKDIDKIFSRNKLSNKSE